MASKTVRSYDVVIVGGGPVGLSMAACLVRFMPELEVAILDRRPFEVPNDARASALAAGVTRLFESLGLWEELLPHSEPIAQMKITDSGQGDLSRPLFLSFDGEISPGRAFAHMVPNRRTISALLDQVRDRVELVAPVEITGFSADITSATLTLKSGDQITAPLIIAADGGRSALRDMAGIETSFVDYKQAGVVTTISHELEHGQTAYEHFRPSGPFASLPLPGKRSSLVWTQSLSEAEKTKLMSEHDQARMIETEMGHVLGKVTLEEPIQSFPLGLRLAKQTIGNRIVLIGDAAHVIHPISGQGMNLGLKDVAALAEVLVEAIRLGQDHGAADVLEKYQNWRRLDVGSMVAATDILNRLFSNDVSVLRALRDAGLSMVDRVPMLKKSLIAHAAAGSGQGPKLLRGQLL